MKRINLLPGTLHPNPVTQILAVSQSLLGKSREVRLMAAFLVALFVFGVAEVAAVKAAKLEVTKEREKLVKSRGLAGKLKTQEQDAAKQRAEVRRQQENLLRSLQAIRQAKQSVVPTSTYLAELGEAVPEDIWITKLTLEGLELKLAGESNRTQAVADLISSLDNSKRFHDSAFDYTQRSEQSDSKTFAFEVRTRLVVESDEPLQDTPHLYPPPPQSGGRRGGGKY